ncbi:uncharacterized protein [Dysidea avara]|uniref:uncharacterized protein n=1 Tax=Dysidea avara TaxID=196820 RepID=UPI003316709A
MQRRERQYAAKRQKGVGAKRKTASVPLVTEQTDQPMEMNSAREEESEIENHDPNSSAQVCEQAVSDGDQNGIECEGNNELLQKLEGMEQTILSQQELIANLSFLLNAKQQHVETSVSSALQTQMQTITLQENFISQLQASLKEATLSPAAKLMNDDEQMHYFTGLSSYALFESLSNLLTSAFKKINSNHGNLSSKDNLLLVLTKLRTAVPNKELSYRFGISTGRVSQIFHEWIDIMARELRQLIVWPDRQMIRKTLPSCFKPLYPRATCIIDCSEIFIERASSLSARSETYSSYKSHNTAKFFVAVSLTGAIIFISKCWGGRVSDKMITSKFGFLDKIVHGDLVLADRGFDIAEDLGLRGASLAIPAFTKGKPQLSQREVETSRKLSNVRIHVERAIGRMKCYKILQNVFPISLLKISQEEDYATIDKILVVVAALCNLQPPLV